MNPTTLGRKVLAYYELGRQRAIAQKKQQGSETLRLVYEFAKLELDKGRPRRGLAGRIHRHFLRTGKPISERHVKRILDTLMSMSDSDSLHYLQSQEVLPHAK